MNVRLVILRVHFEVPHIYAVTGDTQPLRQHVATSFTPSRIAVLVGLAFLAGVVLPLHPAFCIGTLGVLVAVLWKIIVREVRP